MILLWNHNDRRVNETCSYWLVECDDITHVSDVFQLDVENWSAQRSEWVLCYTVCFKLCKCVLNCVSVCVCVVSLPQLKEVDWRVDLVTGSDSVSRMSIPTVLVQLKVRPEPRPAEEVWGGLWVLKRSEEVSLSTEEVWGFCVLRRSEEVSKYWGGLRRSLCTEEVWGGLCVLKRSEEVSEYWRGLRRSLCTEEVWEGLWVLKRSEEVSEYW